MLIIDAHQDLAYNMLKHSRDYSRAASETRYLEAGTIKTAHKEDTLLGWSDYQRGQIGLIFATLFALPARLSENPLDHLVYHDIGQANYLYREQIDLYHRLVDDKPDLFQLVLTKSDLERILNFWQKSASDASAIVQSPPIGLVITMEGAEGVRSISELDEWWEDGLRLIGPAWAGNRFCGGTREPGDLTKNGIEFLEAMAGYGFGLDLSHMDESAALHALDLYPAPVFASHSNALALLKGNEGNRHLTNHLIHAIVERGGVIGVVPFNEFLKPDWRQGDRRELTSLQDVVDHIDHICQLAGNANHAGIGSDFDGGFGLQSVPPEIDTIADLQKLAPMLAERGYSQNDIESIFSKNWLRILDKILPG